MSDAHRIKQLERGYDELRKINNRLLDRLKEADAEVERLRKGGCARDQTTTQFCAEAVALQARLTTATGLLHRWHRTDWQTLEGVDSVDDDTTTFLHFDALTGVKP